MTLSQFGIFGGLSQLGAARKVPWYLSGGVALANCIAAYAAKGAANLAASYINLANPGTYNAAPGVAPTWDAANGWIFNGTTNSRYLTTGVSVNGGGYSAIVRFSDSGAAAASGRVIGSSVAAGGEPRLFLVPYGGGAALRRYYANGGTYESVAIIAGIMAVAGVRCFLNGAYDNSTTAWVGINNNQIFIGADNWAGTASTFYTGYVQAVAIYNTAITDPQVLAVSTAMAAL